MWCRIFNYDIIGLLRRMRGVIVLGEGGEHMIPIADNNMLSLLWGLQLYGKDEGKKNVCRAKRG